MGIRITTATVVLPQQRGAMRGHKSLESPGAAAVALLAQPLPLQEQIVLFLGFRLQVRVENHSLRLCRALLVDRSCKKENTQ